MSLKLLLLILIAILVDAFGWVCWYRWGLVVGTGYSDTLSELQRKPVVGTAVKWALYGPAHRLAR